MKKFFLGSLLYFWLFGASWAQTYSLIQDIYPGTTGAQINDAILVGNKVLMMAGDPTHDVELWISDGTPAGTYMVKDIYAGSDPSYPATFVEMGGYVYFRADHPSYGFEIWRSDGTNAGTTLVKDVNPGTADGFSTTVGAQIVESNGLIFLRLDDGVYGKELWASDGTSTGTIRLLDSYVGSFGGDPKEITPFKNGILFNTFEFDVSLGAGDGRELWFSNGTVGGTYRIMDINPSGGSSSPANFLVVGNKALFSADDGTNGEELWVTDGTPGGTSRISNINPGAGDADISQMVKAGSDVFFFADDGTNGRELWKTDGTVGGTRLVKDINPGSGSSDPIILDNKMLAYNGQLLFVADDGTNGDELWVSDGTAAGTMMLKDINPGSANSFPNYFFEADGKVFFYAIDGINGYELWATDGSAGGTQMLLDINVGTGSSSPNRFIQLGDDLFFTADNGSSGQEPHILDLSTVDLSFPVEWASIEATLQPDHQVRIDWSTASELNNDYFVIERSQDFVHYEAIGTQSGTGNSQTLQHYQALDPTPLSGRSYYRLRQVDFDGTTAFSPVVEMWVDDQATIGAYWQKEQGSLRFHLAPRKKAIPISLIDQQGRVVQSTHIPAHHDQFSWDQVEVPEGMYVLRAVVNGRPWTQRVQVKW